MTMWDFLRGYQSYPSTQLTGSTLRLSWSLEPGELIGLNENLYRPRLSRDSTDESFLFELQDHLMYRRWRCPKETLQVRFHGRSPINHRIVFDERQILALLLCEFDCHLGNSASATLSEWKTMVIGTTIEVIQSYPGYTENRPLYSTMRV